MKIAVTGTHGLIGSELVRALIQEGHSVLRLVRNEPYDGNEVKWDPEKKEMDLAGLEGVDGVVHLAGEGIATGRWTEAKKNRIRESRVAGTQLIAESLTELKKMPKIFISASAIGYYGNRGSEILNEKSPCGKGFLAEVCEAWEAATGAAIDQGIRVVHLRTGIVLSPRGGALAKMLPPFKMGVGGPLGNGKQYMSWIALDDVVGIINFALTDPHLKGPVNVVSPNPVTNRDFTKTLGKTLSRPTVFPMPAFAARLLFGEMADALLLSSARAMPDKLTTAGYKFKYVSLAEALRHLLKK